MINLINFESPPVSTALSMLLKDRTTGKNIIFATDAYEGIDFETPITPRFVLGENRADIRPRVSKSMDEQLRRTRKRAEVFTPSWICNKMNNYCDNQWFGRDRVFNAEYPTDWIANNGLIEMPPDKTWQSYVAAKRLEITCGEAPYLVSRYDAATGDIIAIKNRIGLLDRKLRVINENTGTQKTWLQWVYRAFESVYGYEYQGDNLLIARVNLLETFCEYYRDRWGDTPTESSVKRIADIVSRNIWQMDGIHDCIPQKGAWFPDDEFDAGQVTFFDIDRTLDVQHKQEKMPEMVYCMIHNWDENVDVTYKNLKEGNSMKFDFVIGNPPYQESQEATSDKPVYNYFMDAAYQVADRVELITPARFLFNAGKTSKVWNQKILNDKHFKVLYYEQDSSKIFTNTDIKGGVAITYRDVKTEYDPVELFTSFDELNTIMKKVKQSVGFATLDDYIYAQSKFDLDEVYNDFPKLKKKIGSQGREKRLTTSIFSISELFKDKANDDSVKILGLINNKRYYKCICKKYIDDSGSNLNKHKVILPKSNGSGAIGEVLSTPLIGEPLIGYTQSFIGIGSFDTLNEAEALLKYIKSRFARTLLGVLKITQDNNKGTWKYVPLQDFTSSSDIDWSQSVANIDKQLYKKYNLSEKEIEFIETNVKEMV